MIYISIDLETTGLNPAKHSILEFGAVLEDTSKNIPLEDLPRFQTYINVGDYVVGSPFALQMNAAILKRIAIQEEGYTYMDIEELGESFFSWLRETLPEDYWKKNYSKTKEVITITVAGKNFGTFDLNFLNNAPWFNHNIRIRHRIIDPSMYFVDWENDESLPGLNKCLERAGINTEVTHNAVDDALDVINVLRTVYGGANGE